RSGNDGAYSLSALAAGTYDVRVSATGYQSQTRIGITVSVGGVVTVNVVLAQSGGPAIRITSPTPGSTIADPIALVQGEAQVPTGTPTGVAVNGVPGILENGRFAALVPVDPNLVSLTATLNGISGTLATDTIGVLVSAATQPPQVHLQANPPGG